MGSPIRLALLECDTPIPSVKEKYGDYRDIFEVFLSKSLSNKDVPFTLDGFKVVNGCYPANEDLREDGGYQAILLSGSVFSAYEDLPWIPVLKDFLVTLVHDHPHIKVFGICFGHQMVARAFGGECILNERGWEVGTSEIYLTQEGKQVLGFDSDILSIKQMHRDHVPSLPSNFKLLAQNATCQVQGMVLKYSESTKFATSGEPHILTIQGHPEFLPDIVNKIIDVREASGRMDPATVTRGRLTSELKDGGVDVFGKAFWRILGVE